MSLRVGQSTAVRALAIALAAALVALVAAPGARAELIGQFDAGLRNIKPYGAYTVLASGRVYETSGEPSPLLERAVIHFPRGAALRRQFLVPRFFCDGRVLRANPNPALCARSHFATGEMLVDARPAIEDAFGVSVDLFLGSGKENGATAAVVVLVKSNDKTPVYDYEVLKGYLFKDSGKRFGYRLELPTHLTPYFPDVKLRLAEFHLRMSGLTMVKRVRSCVRKSRRGRCAETRSKKKRLFWIRTPSCPRSRRVTFGADYAFEGSTAISKRRTVSCRRFLRQRTLHRRGKVPG